MNPLNYALLGIMLLASAAVVFAARKARRRRRDRNFVAIPFAASVDTTTLANNTVIVIAALSSVFTEDLRIHSVDGLWASRDGTISEGPLTFGYAHSDYTAAEIAERESVVLTGPPAKIENEQANRLVRRVGQFIGFGAAGTAGVETVNNGNPIRTRLNWLISDGFTLDLWVMNRGSGALTDGPVVEISGTIYGSWQV